MTAGVLEIDHLTGRHNSHEAERAQILHYTLMRDPRAARKWKGDHDAGIRGQAQHRVGHRLHGGRTHLAVACGTIRAARACPEQPHIVINFGRGADRRATGLGGILLLDRDRRADPVHQVHRRLFHALEKLLGIRRQGLDVAPLSFRVKRIECQG
jgi:hypothetical protein